MADITDETYWDREIVTAELDWCADELCRRTGRPADAAGTKGNAAHTRGSHRSQEWILKSAYCTSRTYTVQAGLTSLQARHIAGLDFIPDVWGTARNRALMIEQTGRLLAAMKAGLLDEVHQLFGTLDGKTVTGWDNRANKVITADSSHLDHWHLGLDRTQLTNRALMERIVNIALGDDVALKNDPDGKALIERTNAMFTDVPSVTFRVPGEAKDRTETNKLHAHLVAQDDRLTAIESRPPAELTDADLDALALKVAALIGKLPTVEEIAAAIGRQDAAGLRAQANMVDAPPA